MSTRSGEPSGHPSGNSSRDPFARYRERLDRLGFRPSTARGQNFLLDPSLHRWIADAAGAGADDLVLEIGVGLGFLTRELARSGARVLGVEIDRRLFEVAADELADLDRVTLLLADALGGPAGGLHPDIGRAVAASDAAGDLLVVANLPYAASGPLLAELLCADRLPQRMVLLVQRELAQRLAAGAGSRDYGGLSAQVQAGYRVEVLRKVDPAVFRPRPKVLSAIVRLQRAADAPLAQAPAADRRAFQAFVRALFSNRRKTLRTTLPAALRARPAGGAAGAGTPLSGLPTELLARRAETLSAAELVSLWRATLEGAQ